MKIIQVVNMDKESGKFIRSLLILTGLLFLSTFVLTLLFLVIIGLMDIEMDIEQDAIRLSGITIGLLLGMYVGMCVQKTGVSKWR